MKSSVLNLCLNTDSDGVNETKGGKLFDRGTAVTGNVQSPIVECIVRGMKSTAMLADQSEAAIENHRLLLDCVQERIAVVQRRVDSRMQALSDGICYSHEINASTTSKQSKILTCQESEETRCANKAIDGTIVSANN